MNELTRLNVSRDLNELIKERVPNSSNELAVQSVPEQSNDDPEVDRVLGKQSKLENRESTKVRE